VKNFILGDFLKLDFEGCTLHIRYTTSPALLPDPINKCCLSLSLGTYDIFGRLCDYSLTAQISNSSNTGMATMISRLLALHYFLSSALLSSHIHHRAYDEITDIHDRKRMTWLSRD
jgi:hypothetical protein